MVIHKKEDPPAHPVWVLWTLIFVCLFFSISSIWKNKKDPPARFVNFFIKYGVFFKRWLPLEDSVMFLVESRAWAAFIGPEESMQSRNCICDTHLLRSVIKLCKLGRLDKPWRTRFDWYVNNAMQMPWTDQKLKRRTTKEEESTATCIPSRSLIQDWQVSTLIRRERVHSRWYGRRQRMCCSRQDLTSLHQH